MCYLPISEHVRRFQFWAVTNKHATNTHAQVCRWTQLPFFWDEVPGLGRTVLYGVCAQILRKCSLFFRTTSHFTTYQHSLRLLCTLASIRQALCFSRTQGQLIVVLICICMMLNGVKHLFTCRLPFICTSSLVKCLFMSFAQCLIRFYFSLFHFESSLYILDASPLSDMWFAMSTFCEKRKKKQIKFPIYLSAIHSSPIHPLVPGKCCFSSES